MNLAWLNKADNPGMANWGVQSDDVYGLVALVNFADLLMRVDVTADFELWRPLERFEQLEQLDWLDD